MIFDNKKCIISAICKHSVTAEFNLKKNNNT